MFLAQLPGTFLGQRQVNIKLDAFDRYIWPFAFPSTGTGSSGSSSCLRGS